MFQSSMNNTVLINAILCTRTIRSCEMYCTLYSGVTQRPWGNEDLVSGPELGLQASVVSAEKAGWFSLTPHIPPVHPIAAKSYWNIFAFFIFLQEGLVSC